MELVSVFVFLPVSFLLVSVYSVILGRVLSRWSWLKEIVRWLSILMLLMIGLDLMGVFAFGAMHLKALVGPVYYPVHVVLFLLGVPALANLLLVQKKNSAVSKWPVSALICTLWFLALLLLQFKVSEDLFGVDGMGVPQERRVDG